MRKSMDYKGIKRAVQIISITLIVLIGVFSLLGALIEHAWVTKHFEEVIARRNMIEDIIIGSLFLVDALVLVLAKNKTVKKVMQNECDNYYNCRRISCFRYFVLFRTFWNAV
jgi:hypothetical protein